MIIDGMVFTVFVEFLKTFVRVRPFLVLGVEVDKGIQCKISGLVGYGKLKRDLRLFPVFLIIIKFPEIMINERIISMSFDTLLKDPLSSCIIFIGVLRHAPGKKSHEIVFQKPARVFQNAGSYDLRKRRRVNEKTRYPEIIKMVSFFS